MNTQGTKIITLGYWVDPVRNTLRSFYRDADIDQLYEEFFGQLKHARRFKIGKRSCEVSALSLTEYQCFTYTFPLFVRGASIPEDIKVMNTSIAKLIENFVIKKRS